jgi:hypothetical protein
VGEKGEHDEAGVEEDEDEMENAESEKERGAGYNPARNRRRETLSLSHFTAYVYSREACLLWEMVYSRSPRGTVEPIQTHMSFGPQSG